MTALSSAATQPLVSVVIPCYNHARYLREAIESVLRQDYRPLEVIVVDDGSTDHSPQVCAAYPSVRYFYQRKAGLPTARNRGIQESTGRYLLFLDADDRLCPGALECAVRFILDHPDCGFVYGQFYFVDEHGRVLEDYDKPRQNPDDYLGLFRGNHIAMCATVLFPHTVLDRVGMFRPELRASEDYDLYFRIARVYPYLHHSTLMAECRRHSENMSLDASLMLRSTLQVVRFQRQYIGEDTHRRNAYHEADQIWKDYYGGLLLKQIRQDLRNHDFLQASRKCTVLLRFAPQPLLRSIARILGKKAARMTTGAFRRLTPVSHDFGYDRGTPIDRYYIERHLAKFASDIRGHVLEIKDDSYTRRFGSSRVTQSDVLDVSDTNLHATIVADLAWAPQIVSDTFDCILITQTLHLIFDLPSAIRTLHRILKPGGTVLATVPGFSQIARDGMNRWQDYWRFTTASARRLFDDPFAPANVTVSAFGNLCAAVNFLDGRAAEELEPEKLDHFDDDYQLLIFIRAVKNGPAQERSEGSASGGASRA